jgi:hypothetical protein
MQIAGRFRGVAPILNGWYPFGDSTRNTGPSGPARASIGGPTSREADRCRTVCAFFDDAARGPGVCPGAALCRVSRLPFGRRRWTSTLAESERLHSVRTELPERSLETLRLVFMCVDPCNLHWLRRSRGGGRLRHRFECGIPPGNLLSLKKLVYLDGHKAALYRSRMNRSLGRNLEALDPLEWLARMSDPIPDPGQHRTILYGHYANRTREARRRDECEWPETSAEPSRRRSSPTWARLIARIYQTDPLVCSRCGQKMQIIAFLKRPALDPKDSRPPRAVPARRGRTPAPQRAPPRRRAGGGLGSAGAPRSTSSCCPRSPCASAASGRGRRRKYAPHPLVEGPHVAHTPGNDRTLTADARA